MPKILAIDDVYDNLIAIESILKSFLPDCQVFLAESGEKGIEMAEELKPDTILLDILMPEMDGYEVCIKLKNQESTRQIPVIMVSALGSISESRVKGLNAGADVFISKPIDSGELVAQVKVMLRIKEVEDDLRMERNNLEKLVEIRTGKLIESQRRYKSIVEDQTQAIIRYKKEGILTFVNDSYCKMQKRKREELIGLSLYTLVAPNDIERVRNKIEGLSIEKPVEVDEHRSIFPDGSVGWQQWTDRAFFDSSGKLIDYQAEGIDITDRKKAEKNLRESEEKFRQLAENIGQAFWLASPDMENIFYISPAYEEIWGKSCESLIENPVSWFDSIVEEDKILVKSVLDEFPEDYQELKFPAFRIIKPDGSIRWILASAYPIKDERGRIIRIAGLAKDNTEWKKIEEAISQISGGVDNVTGDAFFHSLVQSLITVLDVEFALVGQYDKEENGMIKTMVVNHSGKSLENFTYPLEGSPCNKIVKGELCIYKENVRNEFRDDSLLEKIGANSFAGIPLFSSANNLLGIIIVLDKKPFLETELVKTILQVFSARAGAELERINTEKALVESEEKFRKVFHSSPDSILIIRISDKQIIEVNDGFELIFGISKDKIIGKTYYDIDIFKDSDILENLIALLEEQQIVNNLECRIKLEKDKTGYGLLSAQVLDLNNEKYILSIIRDVTQKKNAEEALRVSEEKFRTIVETSPDSIMTIDIDSNIIYASKQAADAYGFTDQNEIIGMNLSKLIAPEKRNRIVGSLKKALQEGTARDEEYVLMKKNGSTYYGEFSCSVIRNKKGNPDGFIVITKDITERKNAENAIKVYQQNLKSMTSELNLAVEKERRRIAVDLHDHLGQSLAMARIKLSGMKNEELPEQTTENIKETEKYVIDAIKNSRTLTYELSPPVLFELGLAAAINWKLEQLNTKNNIETDLEVIDEIPELSEDLLILLFRSVGELLNNIIKHAKAKLVSVRINFKGKYLNISVEDDGVGFETKEVDTKFYKTSGIGLFSIRERLEYFHGKMYIESELNKGTKIYLSVPVN